MFCCQVLKYSSTIICFNKLSVQYTSAVYVCIYAAGLYFIFYYQARPFSKDFIHFNVSDIVRSVWYILLDNMGFYTGV